MKISIIVPVYNAQPYLRRCINSIIDQSVDDFEIILINDGSTDESGSICDAYAASNKRIRVIHQQNKGLLMTRAIGINHARGDWIGFVDADDYISPRRFEKMLETGDKEKSDAVMGDLVEVKEPTGKIFFHPYSEPLSCRHSISGHDFLSRILESCGKDYEWHVVWAKIYKRELLLNAAKSISAFNVKLTMCEDVVWQCAIACHMRKLAFCHGEVYYYFRGENCSTSGSNISELRLFSISEDLIKGHSIASKILAEKTSIRDAGSKVNRWFARHAVPWRDLCDGRYPEINRRLTELISNHTFNDTGLSRLEVEIAPDDVFRLQQAAEDIQKRVARMYKRQQSAIYRFRNMAKSFLKNLFKSHAS